MKSLVLNWNYIVYYNTFLWAAKFPRGTTILSDFSSSNNTNYFISVSLTSSSPTESTPVKLTPGPDKEKSQGLNTLSGRKWQLNQLANSQPPASLKTGFVLASLCSEIFLQMVIIIL